ncbi:hypothetical protein PCANB_000803 [Pneumocystis canis]|nr:hypothetical protein PCK1_000897 [Pneumocystis canis]KAG5437372.1 hypothetical protein PCANB_000803 [Pneumocystis canis]
MTDVWKSVGNYWCKYCKTFVRNDAFSRRRHEESDRHKDSIKYFLRNLDKKHEREEREKKAVQRELDRIAGVTGLSTRSLDTVPLKKVPKLTTQKAKPIPRTTKVTPPIDIRSTVGIPGAWEVVPKKEEKGDAKEISDTSKNTSISQNIPMEFSTLQLPRLKEEYEDLNSFKIKEKVLPLETKHELEETTSSDFFKKRKFGANKNIRKK